MECEVCGHKLIPGIRECPNCGWKLKYDKNVKVNHIEYFDEKPKVKKKTSLFQKIMKVFLGIIIGLIIVSGLLIGSLFVIFNDDTDKIVEMIESGEDDSFGTVVMASNHKDKLVNTIETFEFSDVSVEVYLEETSKGYYVDYDIYCYDDTDITYYISFAYNEGKCTDYYLNAWGDIEIEGNFPLPKLDMFSEILGYKSIVGEFIDVRNPQDEDFYYNDEQISITEEYNYKSDDYVDYSIAAKGYTLNND